MALTLLPIAKWTHILGTIGRVILLYCSYSKPKVCKLYLHYEMFMMLIDSLIVTDLPSESVLQISLLKMTILFYNFYYQFIPSMCAVCAAQICHSIIHSFLYE